MEQITDMNDWQTVSAEDQSMGKVPLTINGQGGEDSLGAWSLLIYVAPDLLNPPSILAMGLGQVASRPVQCVTGKEVGPGDRAPAISEQEVAVLGKQH